MRKILVVLYLVVFSGYAQSGLFCVGNSVEFQAALTAARNNGEDDEIRLRSGNYPVINNVAFTFSPDEDFSIKISGGWFDFNQFNCFSQVQVPWQTTIDGLGLASVLFFGFDASYTDYTIDISNLGIINGSPNNSNSAGLNLSFPPNHQGSALVDRVYFADNFGQRISALSISSARLAIVRNSVFEFNENELGFGTVNVGIADGGQGLYFINNTMIDNSHQQIPSGASSNSGLRINVPIAGVDGFPKTIIANNLFWFNRDNDITLTSNGSVFLLHNNYQEIFGTADISSGNLSVSPGISNAPFDFTPEPGSALINAGMNQTCLLYTSDAADE